MYKVASIMYQVSSIWLQVSSYMYQGTSISKREQVVAIWNFFIQFFFFTRASPRGARAPKNKNSFIDAGDLV